MAAHAPQYENLYYIRLLWVNTDIIYLMNLRKVLN